MKTLPAENAEPIILNLALTNPTYTTFLSEYFERGWFKDEHLGNVLYASLKYFQKYGKPPSKNTVDLIVAKTYNDETVRSDVVSKMQAVYEIDSNKYDTDFLEEQVILYLKNSGLYNTIMDSLDDIEKHHNVESCMEKLKKLSCMDFSYDLGFQYFEDIEEHLNEVQNPQSRISTGWPTLDEITNGGFYKEGKCLGLFIGESHIGKSLFLSNLASNLLKQDKFIVIISLEMSELVYGCRVDAHLSKHNVNRLAQNIDSIRQSIKSIKDKYPNSKLIIKEFPPASISCNHIKTYLDKVISVTGRKPDMIIIDYVNLLMPNGAGIDGDNLYVKVGKITQEMRALSYTYESPVISVSQVNRGGYDSTEIGLDDISESIGTVFVSDFISSIWQSEGDREAGIIRLTVLKNRLGGQIGKKVQFSIDYSNLVISEIATTSTVSAVDKLTSSLLNDSVDSVSEIK